jgi:cobalt-zinc-cadmium efflux system membrane fusion protein
MTRRQLSRCIAPLLAACLAACLSCSNETKASASRKELTLEAGVYDVDRPDLFELAEVESRNLPDVLRTNGSVTPDVSRTIRVTSLGSGRVLDLRARLGDKVNKGQILLRISSPDLATAMADDKKARADESLSHKALERTQLLFSHGALAEKDLQLAQDTEDKAKVDLQATEERVHILGGDPAQPGPLIELRAPVSGTIVEQNVSGFEGVKSLDNTPNLFTIADLSMVWVLCDVYENDLGIVELGDAAEIHLNAYPDKVFRGVVQDISRVLDPATRSAKVRVVLHNPDGSLRPGMFAIATFRSRRVRPRLVVPGTAIMRLQDKDWVFRKEGDRRFRRVEVHTLGEAGSGMVQIEDGLKPGLKNGDQIVSTALDFSTAMAGQDK